MSSRRDFVSASVAAAVGVGVPEVWKGNARFDVVIKGGAIFDGAGGEERLGDVAIMQGRVVAMGPEVRGPRNDEVDARGLAVAPGFIDIHSHGDGSLGSDARAESVIRQGVTTIVVGQDGSGSATEDVLRWRRTMDANRPAVNVATMLGLGTVRRMVVGEVDRPASTRELARMLEIVRRGLAAGACGLSSGLEYTPGAFASARELEALCAPLARYRRPYATHMRNEDDRLLESIDESIAVARAARCPLQISHLKTQGPRNWGKLDDAFERIERARGRGVDVTFDRYPYTAYQTGLSNLFPVWSRDGGSAQFLARLAGGDARIREETLAKVDLIGGWQNVMIAGVQAASDRTAEGKRMDVVAQSLGSDPYAAAVGLLIRSGGSVGMVGFAMSEENLDRILAHPLGMVCSDGAAFAIDGPTRRGSPHPRGGGSFPRVLGRYVRERRALPLSDAIRKMTSAPAERIGLRRRGRLAIGAVADLVVFDPRTIADSATYEAPFAYPVGISAVMVAGSFALRDGERARHMSGKALLLPSSE